MQFCNISKLRFRAVERNVKLIMILSTLVFFTLLYVLLYKSQLGDYERDYLIVFPHNMQRDQKCVHPELDPFHPSVMHFFEKLPRIECSRDDDWVYVVNGTFHISQKAKRKYGKITCEYDALARVSDYSTRHRDDIKTMLDRTPIVSDFFTVACVSDSGKKYFNIHSGVAYNKTIHDWLERKKHLHSDGFGVDLLMFGFDSVSRMNWIRTLPQTRDYFLKHLRGIELEGYNIVGDGTVQALLPLLTGKTEDELPKARRGFEGSKPVDNHPLIWKEFKKKGYLTAWAEDMAFIGTFQYRMLGFDHQPTDHYMRPFYLAAETMYPRNEEYCLGSVPRHKNFMKWFQDVYAMYEDKRKFMFGFHSELSHDDNNELQLVDTDLKEFLHFLERSGYLNKSILILMSDHGARYSSVRRTAQGQKEARMPYFAFRFPPWFEKQYPEIVNNMRINSKRLTTPFDIHETFHDFLDYRSDRVDKTKRGISLMKEIPKDRTCEEAGVEPHWCACLAWKNVNLTNSLVQRAAVVAVDHINLLTEVHREKCAKLSLKSIIRSLKTATNSKVLQFKQSSDFDGRQADLSDKTRLEEAYYQLTFITTPGNGQFEVTLKHAVKGGDITVQRSDICRINKYGNAPSCIANDFPYIRPYCYCKYLIERGSN